MRMIRRLMPIVFIVMLPFAVFAQTKVAILPAIDRTGEIKYTHKQLLISSLTTAISMTDGYEAYDRIDLSSVLDEQQFQRTGLVSDAEIHKIGEMTGVSYVLITEAAYLDASTLLASAKIENVESAKIDNSATAVIKLNDSDDILNSCAVLSNRLLGSLEYNTSFNSIKNSTCFYLYRKSKSKISSPYRITCPNGSLNQDILSEIHAFTRVLKIEDDDVIIVGPTDICQRVYSCLTNDFGIPSYTISIIAKQPNKKDYARLFASERYIIFDDGLFERHKMSDFEYFLENTQLLNVQHIEIQVFVSSKTGSLMSNRTGGVQAENKIYELLNKHMVPKEIVSSEVHVNGIGPFANNEAKYTILISIERTL